MEILKEYSALFLTIVISNICYTDTRDIDVKSLLKILGSNINSNVLNESEEPTKANNLLGSLDGFEIRALDDRSVSSDEDETRSRPQKEYSVNKRNQQSLSNILSNVDRSPKADAKYESLANIEKILSQSISDYSNNKQRNKLKRLQPNNLMQSGHNQNNKPLDLSDYSKIFIVLNPEAIRDKSTFNINRLIKSLERKSNKYNENRNNYNEDLLSRRLGPSNERFAPRDSGEFGKQKRPRARFERGGGGGGGAGRTAIPYVGRNRGENIYEKD